MKDDQASSTAFTVLQGILYTGKKPKYAGLVSEETKEACIKILSASKEGQKRLKQLKSWWYVGMVPMMEYLIMPGITLHYVLRKSYIRDYAEQQIQAGITQVMNLGAGFDTLAYQFSKEHPNINFIEIDHPATHQAKIEALVTPETTAKNLHFLPVDFMIQTVEESLQQYSGFDPDRPTLIIIEGVLMYLDEIQIRQLFKSLQQIIHANIKIIFTAVEPASKSQYSYGPLLKMYLKMKNESLGWCCEREHAGQFLESMDYNLDHIAGTNEFKQRYLKPNHKGILHEGEYMIVADYTHGETSS